MEIWFWQLISLQTIKKVGKFRSYNCVKNLRLLCKNTDGCGLGAPPVRVTVILRQSDILNGGPYETTIQTFAIGNDAPYSGKFVGISAMRLTRGSEVLELERRPGNETCP